MSHETLPVYGIEDFSAAEAQGNQFYINAFSEHLHRHDFIARPHRHDFYLVVHFEQGSGRHFIDFNAYDVVPGAVFFLAPGQVHSFADVTEAKGTILFFSKEFMEGYFVGKRVADYPFFRIGAQELTIGADENAQWLQGLFREMKREFHVRDRHSADLIRDYLDILLLRLGRLAAQKVGRPVSSAAHWQLRALEDLIEDHFLTKHSAADYADMLHLSVKYLNELCRKHLGKTTTQLIQERVALEAKRLLTYEENSISQVAHKLNFQDASYFSRFFRKMTGQSPEQFRKGVLQK